MEPANRTIADVIGPSCTAAHFPMLRARQQGLLHWMHLSKPTDEPQPSGPPVGQASNAYALLITENVKGRIARLIGKGPHPACGEELLQSMPANRESTRPAQATKPRIMLIRRKNLDANTDGPYGLRRLALLWNRIAISRVFERSVSKDHCLPGQSLEAVTVDAALAEYTIAAAALSSTLGPVRASSGRVLNPWL